MHTTKVSTVGVNHNSDWSGDVRLFDSRTGLDHWIYGPTFLALVQKIAENQRVIQEEDVEAEKPNEESGFALEIEGGQSVGGPVIPPGDLIFQVQEKGEMIRLRPNGDIFVRGNLVENDKDVVDALREFVHMARGERFNVEGHRIRRLIIDQKFNETDCGDCDFCNGANDDSYFCDLFEDPLGQSIVTRNAPARHKVCLQYDEDPEIRRLGDK